MDSREATDRILDVMEEELGRRRGYLDYLQEQVEEILSELSRDSYDLGYDEGLEARCEDVYDAGFEDGYTKARRIRFMCLR